MVFAPWLFVPFRPGEPFPGGGRGHLPIGAAPLPRQGKVILSDSEAYRTAFHAAASGSPRRL